MADIGVLIPPAGFGDAEIAMGLYIHARRIRARRVLSQAQAVSVGMGTCAQAALVDLQVDAGRDRGEAELEASKRALEAAPNRMASQPL